MIEFQGTGEHCASHVRSDENILCILCMLVYDNNGGGTVYMQDSSSHASMCVCAQCVSVRECV